MVTIIPLVPRSLKPSRSHDLQSTLGSQPAYGTRLQIGQHGTQRDLDLSRLRILYRPGRADRPDDEIN